MWSVWLVFCDCGFHLSVLWWIRIRGLWKLPGWGCVPSLLFDLRPNYGGVNEDNGYLLEKVPWRHVTLSTPDPVAGHCWPTPPPETHGQSRASLGQSLVGSLLLFPESWCSQVSVYALQESVSQSCISSGSSMVGLMATSSKKAYTIPRSAAPRVPAPVAGHCWPSQETLKHSSGSVSVGSLGPCAHKHCLSPLSISGG